MKIDQVRLINLLIRCSDYQGTRIPYNCILYSILWKLTGEKRYAICALGGQGIPYNECEKELNKYELEFLNKQIKDAEAWGLKLEE
jgi:hypothetical protein